MSHRLEYIDALRGLAILLVVFMHVPQYGFGCHVGGYYMLLAQMLAVPLFFFISGLFVPTDVTPPVSAGKYLKRAHAILLPTIVIGVVYALLNGIPLEDMLQDKYKGGYWFTLTLFEYYVMADVVRLMTFKRQKTFEVLLVVAALACYALGMPSVQRCYGDISVAHVLGIEQWKYFLFFVMGMFVRRLSHKIQSDNGGALIVTAFLIVYVANAIGGFHLNGIMYNANLLLQQTTIVLLVYYLFFRHQDFFCSKTMAGRSLLLIGTSTLEIYLLHYFVLPRHLEALAANLDLQANPFAALMVDLFITVCIMAVVLGLKAVLQCNPYVRKLLWNK